MPKKRLILVGMNQPSLEEVSKTNTIYVTLCNKKKDKLLTTAISSVPFKSSTKKSDNLLHANNYHRNMSANEFVHDLEKRNNGYVDNTKAYDSSFEVKKLAKDLSLMVSNFIDRH